VRISLLFSLLPLFFLINFFVSLLPDHATSCARSRVSCAARIDGMTMQTCRLLFLLPSTIAILYIIFTQHYVHRVRRKCVLINGTITRLNQIAR